MCVFLYIQVSVSPDFDVAIGVLDVNSQNTEVGILSGGSSWCSEMLKLYGMWPVPDSTLRRCQLSQNSGAVVSSTNPGTVITDCLLF